jgi:hypothetical protein
VIEDEFPTTAQRARRRSVRLALVIAVLALAVYFGWWLKVFL